LFLPKIDFVMDFRYLNEEKTKFRLRYKLESD